MYTASVELMQPEIDAAVNEAVSEAVDETTYRVTAQKTVEAIENAMKKLGMSEYEACALMDTTVETYKAYKACKELLRAPAPKRATIKDLHKSVEGTGGCDL